MLVSYASNPEHSRGRKIFELPDLYRNNFEKDRERIIHSNAFKRLEYKTQVVDSLKGDHYRNRPTHSLEVANIARIIAKKLSLSEDLAECIALAHDLGHTPFGHAGEDALNQSMKEYGGFCHNAFSIKLLDVLEKRYASFDGLNLSWEVIEGIAKHNGPIEMRNRSNDAIFAYDEKLSLDLKLYPSAEAQVASISDDIAYNSHDIEDGLRSKMFEIDDLNKIEFFKKHIAEIRSKEKSINDNVLSYEVNRIFTKTLVQDLIDNSSNNFYNYKIKELNDIHNLGKNVISFSQENIELVSSVRNFLRENFYCNHKINLVSFRCRKIVKGLFEVYMANPECLAPEWQKQISVNNKAQIICNYIAGMTDRYAIKEFEEFYSVTSIDL